MTRVRGLATYIRYLHESDIRSRAVSPLAARESLPPPVDDDGSVATVSGERLYHRSLGSVRYDDGATASPHTGRVFSCNEKIKLQHADDHFGRG